MPVQNYQKKLEQLLDEVKNTATPKRLFLHSCCAPCSSYVLEYLAEYFEITLFFYNPNMDTEEEFVKRADELQRLVSELPVKYPVTIQVGEYHPEKFYEMAHGMETMPEGDTRCFACYELRLRETAKLAQGYDFFTTTLSISPYKNAQKLNEIGLRLAEEYQVAWLPSDFKKKNGYKRSIELSEKYNLYRQNYCGCIYSKGND